MPTGPDSRVKITDAYAALVARDVYFWAWPMVNVYNRRLYFSKIAQQLAFSRAKSEHDSDDQLRFVERLTAQVLTTPIVAFKAADRLDSWPRLLQFPVQRGGADAQSFRRLGAVAA